MTKVDHSRTGRCVVCGYLLRDLPVPRCPECGRAFNPRDRTTMRMHSFGEQVKRWLFARLGIDAVVVVAVAMILLVWLFSTPGPYYLGIGLVLFAAITLTPAVLLWTAPQFGGKVRRCSLLAVMIITCSSITFLQLPLRIRFALSAPAWNRLLTEVRAYPETPRPKAQWVGLFRVGEIRLPRNGSTVWRFYEPGSTEVGFGFSDTPVGYGGNNMGAGGHLRGGWYWFSDD